MPLKLAAIGIILQLSAGPFDFWWHNQFGFDGLLSPPHSILATGMFMASLGALIGLCRFKKYNSDKLFTINTNDINNETNSPVKSLLLLAVPFSVFWMVSIGIIFMFTLPFSKGQYFDFNPNPVAAIIANATLIPFVTAIIFFVISIMAIVGRTSHTTSTFTTFSSTTISTNKRAINHIPFIFTVITAYVMVMQITTTIISNPYFIGNTGLYLLNILPAIVCDILLLKYRKKIRYNYSNNDKNKYILNRRQQSVFSVLFDNRKRNCTNCYNNYFGILYNFILSMVV